MRSKEVEEHKDDVVQAAFFMVYAYFCGAAEASLEPSPEAFFPPVPVSHMVLGGPALVRPETLRSLELALLRNGASAADIAETRALGRGKIK